MTKYPGINLQLTESDSNTLYDEALQDNIDLILDAGICDHNLFTSEFLCLEKILFAVPWQNPINKQYADFALTQNDILKNRHLSSTVKHISLSGFCNERLILLKKGHDMHTRSIALCEHAGFTPRLPIYLNQLSTAANIGAEGIGCCFLTDSLVKYGALKKNAFLFYALDDEIAQREMFIAYHKNRNRTKAMERFIQVAKGMFQPID